MNHVLNKIYLFAFSFYTLEYEELREEIYGASETKDICHANLLAGYSLSLPYGRSLSTPHID